MRVQFTVYGANEAEIIDAARQALDGFSQGRRWNIRYSAHSPMQSADGVTMNLWQCEVDAEHEEVEA